MKRILPFFVLLVLSACTDYSAEENQVYVEKIKSYVSKNKLDAQETSSGVFFNVMKEGDGAAIRYTDKITVTYKGTLLNGKVFDERTEPISFNLRNLIPGWKEILPGTKIGSSVLIICPPSMGYGTSEKEKIPANSILIFEINLLSVE